ncbi:MAG: hypothetical protein NW215_05270 [Hyphomicrobiales bacterium]|nr:hypothetical protein [Hyphomicrobiales bacterium]
MENDAHLERLIAEALTDFASELRLIEAADFVAYLRLGQFANVAALVTSAAELFFKPGALAFTEAGSAELGWSGAPAITLDLKLNRAGVAAEFALRLTDRAAAVRLRSLAIRFPDESDQAAALAAALADARRPPRKAQASSRLYN